MKARQHKKNRAKKNYYAPRYKLKGLTSAEVIGLTILVDAYEGTSCWNLSESHAHIKKFVEGFRAATPKGHWKP